MMNVQQRPGPPPRNKAILPLACCGCLLLGMILIGVLGYSAFRAGTAMTGEAEKGADQFLTALEKQGNQAAFDMMASKVHKLKTVETITDVMEVLAKTHGRPVSHQQLPGFNMNTFNGETTVQMVYQETFEKGAVPVQMVLVAEAGKWRVISFNFQL